VKQSFNAPTDQSSRLWPIYISVACRLFKGRLRMARIRQRPALHVVCGPYPAVVGIDFDL